MTKDILHLARSVKPLKVNLGRGGRPKKGASPASFTPKALSDEEYTNKLTSMGLHHLSDPSISPMNLFFSKNPQYMDELKAQNQQYSLNQQQKDLFPGKADGGELKDPTKRAAFMNLFNPKPANLPAIVAAPAPAPSTPEENKALAVPSSGPASAENPDLIAKATKALMEAPVSRRKFLETSRNAVAAVNQAKNINKLLKPKKMAIKKLSPNNLEKARDALSVILKEPVNENHPILKNLVNKETLESLAHTMERDHDENPIQMHEIAHGGGDTVSYMDPEMEDEIYNRAHQHIKNDLEWRAFGSKGPKISDEEFKNLLDEMVEKQRNQPAQSEEPEHEAHGGFIHKESGGSLSERRAAAQAKIKELSAQLRDPALSAEEKEAIKQQIKDQGQIVAQKGEAPPPQKPSSSDQNKNPEFQPMRVKNVLGTYSHAAEVTQKAKQEKMTPEQWVNFLEKKSGVKSDELKWADIAGMHPPAGQKTVSREDVARRLEDANINDYEENIRDNSYRDFDSHGNRINDSDERRMAVARDALKDPKLFKEIFGDDYLAMDQELREKEDDLKQQGHFDYGLREGLAEHLNDNHAGYLNRYTTKKRAKHEQYTLKEQGNNKNYREIVAQWKPEKKLFQYDMHYPEYNPLFHMRLADLHDPVPAMTDDEVYELARKAGVTVPLSFQTGEPQVNNLASGFLHQVQGRIPKEDFDRLHSWWLQKHPGDKQFGPAPGKKYLHVEEVQGDWGQKGRGRFGERDDMSKDALHQEYKRLDDEYDNIYDEYSKAKDKIYNELYVPVYQHQDRFEKLRYTDEGDRYTDYWRNLSRDEKEKILEDHQKEYYRLANIADKQWDDHQNNNFKGTEVEPISKKLGEFADLRDEAYEKYRKARESVPPGPHVTDTDKWTNLAVKRLLKEMVDGGYHGIVLTNGDQQSKRWMGQPGVKSYYDETLEPAIEKAFKSHDPAAGKIKNRTFPLTKKTHVTFDYPHVAETVGMPYDRDSPDYHNQRVAVHDYWRNLTQSERDQVEMNWRNKGNDYQEQTIADLPLYETTPKANESISNNQKLFRRGGDVKAPVAKSKNKMHTPAIIGQALNKIHSLPRDMDSTLSGQQGRLF